MYLLHLKLLSAIAVIFFAPTAGYLFLQGPEEAVAIFAPSIIILIVMFVFSLPAFFVFIACVGLQNLNMVRFTVPWKVPSIMISVLLFYLFYTVTALVLPLLNESFCFLTFALLTALIAALTLYFYRKSIRLYDSISIMR